MTEYKGCKSLDAEITLDFVKGTINMDYSLNKYGSMLDSNTSICFNGDEWYQLSTIEKLKNNIVHFLFSMISVPFVVFTGIFTIEERIGIVGSKAQYEYQKILKWYFSHDTGIWEQSKSGELHDNSIIFTIPKNIWVEYITEGEYQTNLKAVSLVRNFVTHLKFGKFPCKRQIGWNIIFEFTEPPKKGSCKIKYV